MQIKEYFSLKKLHTGKFERKTFFPIVSFKECLQPLGQVILPLTLAHFYVKGAELDSFATVQARHYDSENLSFESLPIDYQQNWF